MATHKTITRRGFLKGAGAAAAVGFPTVIPSTALGDRDRPAPSERINMGFVGVGGQGSGDMGGFLGFPQVQGLAVCDVDKNHRDRAKKTVDVFKAEKQAGTIDVPGSPYVADSQGRIYFAEEEGFPKVVRYTVVKN